MTDTNLTGSYSATWVAQAPDGSGGYTQQATLALFRFDKKDFHGLIHLYRGGAPEYRTIPVKGHYELKHNDGLKAIDGLMYVGLLAGTEEPPIPNEEQPFQTQELYIVRRKKAEFDFLLIKSLPAAHTERVRGGEHGDTTGFPLPPHPPNAIVQGTFKRCD